MNEKEIQEFRKSASLTSLGSSSDQILEAFIKRIKDLLKEGDSLIDIGCGQGNLLKRVQELGVQCSLTGVDYTNFKDYPFPFIQQDCNLDFKEEFSCYDIVVASEVIEHIENPRHFMRQLDKILKDKGHLLLSTPNPESILSILTFFVKGHHNAFGPKDYPAHITPVTAYHMKNIIEEMGHFRIEELFFIPNGRIPGSALSWQSFFPGISGKRFSDNYLIHLKKI